MTKQTKEMKNLINSAHKNIQTHGFKKTLVDFYNHTRRGPLLPLVAQYTVLKNRYVNGYCPVAHPLNTYFIDPDKIKYLTGADIQNPAVTDASEMMYVKGTPKDHQEYRYIDRGKFKTVDHLGRIVGGSWDQSTAEFTDLHVYRAIENRFENNVPWEETTYFELVTQWMDSGYIVRGCTTPTEYKQVCKRTEKVYKSIIENGYIPQSELAGKSQLHEIGVNIGRDGDLLFNSDGHHRLSIAKLLEVEYLPVIVICRHQEWQAKRERLHRLNDWDNLTKKEHDLIMNAHPDLRDIDYPHPA